MAGGEWRAASGGPRVRKLLGLAPTSKADPWQNRHVLSVRAIRYGDTAQVEARRCDW